jgi:hypothetical protein
MILADGKWPFDGVERKTGWKISSAKNGLAKEKNGSKRLLKTVMVLFFCLKDNNLFALFIPKQKISQNDMDDYFNLSFCLIFVLLC